MASILTMTKAQPLRQLAAGDMLITEGDPGSDLFVLESGRLVVTREGVTIATIDEPGALIGEMGVLLGIDHSASVRAETAASVRVIEEGVAFLERTPLMALHVATLACERLEKTSALVVELRREAEERAEDHGMFGRIFGALTSPTSRGRTAG